MAAVFAMIWCLVLVGLLTSVLGLRWWRAEDGRYARWLMPVVAVFTILLLYLVVKVVYEEIVPCVSVDRKYCNFGSTQYRNLFGWEF